MRKWQIGDWQKLRWPPVERRTWSTWNCAFKFLHTRMLFWPAKIPADRVLPFSYCDAIQLSPCSNLYTDCVKQFLNNFHKASQHGSGPMSNVLRKQTQSIWTNSSNSHCSQNIKPDDLLFGLLPHLNYQLPRCVASRCLPKCQPCQCSQFGRTRSCFTRSSSISSSSLYFRLPFESSFFLCRWFIVLRLCF